MPSPLPHGGMTPPSPSASAARHHHYHFRPTGSSHKLRRLNALMLLLRFAAFCFSFSAAVFMLTDSSRSPASPSWADFDSFRFVLAANAIVAVYSFTAMGVVVWEILKGAPPLPEAVQLCLDFGHDQVFAYVLLAAEAAGTEAARGLRRSRACAGDSAFCTQAYISVGLGFAGFAFVALSAVLSGYRLACYIITGSLIHL